MAPRLAVLMLGGAAALWAPSGSSRSRHRARRSLARRQGLARPDSYRRDATAWRLGLHRRPLRFRPIAPPRRRPGARRRRRRGRRDRRPRLGGHAERLVARPRSRTRRAARRHACGACARGAGLVRAARDRVLPLPAALTRAPRRARALAALTVFNLVKGLDVEEAALTAVAAALLWVSRSSFYVRHEPATLRSALWRMPLLLAGVFLVSLAAVAFAAPATASAAEIVRGDRRPAPLAARAVHVPRRARATRGSRSS